MHSPAVRCAAARRPATRPRHIHSDRQYGGRCHDSNIRHFLRWQPSAGI